MVFYFKTISFVYIVSLISLNATSQRKNLIFECTFDSSGAINQWYEKSIYNSWSAVGVSTPTRKGFGALKVELIRNSDTLNGPRAELGMPPQTEPEFWYGFSNFFPSAYISDPTTEIVNQWQALPDFDLNESWRSPPLALEIKDNRFKVAIRWSTQKVSTPKNIYIDYLDIGPAIHDMWLDWVFHVKWNYGKNGILEIWRNNKLILKRINKPIGYNDIYYPYFKIGIYKWEWNNPLTISTSTNRTYYIDEVRIGNASAKYKDVYPNSYLTPELNGKHLIAK